MREGSSVEIADGLGEQGQHEDAEASRATRTFNTWIQARNERRDRSSRSRWTPG
jgi:hypothetical protein